MLTTKLTLEHKTSLTDESPKEKANEISVISKSHTASDHKTVMILSQDTIITQRTVMTTSGNHKVAGVAVFRMFSIIPVVAQSSGKEIVDFVQFLEVMETEQIPNNIHYH